MCLHLSAYRRIALLPFALSVERLAPVPVGGLNSKRVLPSQNRSNVPVSRDALPPRPRLFLSGSYTLHP
jgi:hypothetical protein